LINVNVREDIMSRIQLALNVSDLDEAIEFYAKFFKSEPAKVRPGYANFAIDEPPLKLVLIEGVGQPGSINHLGVEVFSAGEVNEATNYFAEIGLAARVESETTCCYAVQDKVWVGGPDHAQWEVYTVLADAAIANGMEGDSTCCSSEPAPTSEASVSTSSCC